MKKLASIIASILYASHAYAFEPFQVKDIRVEGLQRISIGAVFNYLPIKVGEKISESDTTQAIHALYKTGFFKDVRLDRDGDVLVVFVAERPAIAEIHINGNDKIPTDIFHKHRTVIATQEFSVFFSSGVHNNLISCLNKTGLIIGKGAKWP